jgi:hypothetical protein
MKLPHAVLTSLKLGIAASSLAPLGCQPGDAMASIPNDPAPAAAPIPQAAPPPPDASPEPAPTETAAVRVVRLKPVKVTRPVMRPAVGVVPTLSPERRRRDPCPACGMG